MSQGFQSSLGIDTANPVTRGFDFDSCMITADQTHLDSSGIRGSRSRHSERTRLGPLKVAGSIDLYPSAADLALLLPWILGGTADGTTYPLAEELSSRYVTVDKVVQVATYAGVYVDKATFSASEGQAMKLSLDLLGQTETVGTAGSFPSVTYDNAQPYLCSDSVLTMLSATRQVKTWTLTIDNMLAASFNNSITATSIVPTDRSVTFDCTNPFTSDDADLYNQALAGAAATLVLTDGDATLSFDFATLQVPRKGPTIGGRQEIPLVLSGVVRMVGTAPELSVSLS